MTFKSLFVSGAVCIACVLPGIYAMLPSPESHKASPPAEPAPTAPDQQTAPDWQTATFGNGCFWCTEAVFQQLKGVESVVSGYSGGHVADPTYEQVCTGTTGHAEAIQVNFDANVISYGELLEVFWRTHDPTTPDRQGNDIGPQYRSVVFYHNEQQRDLAGQFKQELDAAGVFSAPIVTEIVPFEKFYPAEDYHQRFYDLNPNQRYCRFVIGPKLEKFEQAFRHMLKDEAK